MKSDVLVIEDHHRRAAAYGFAWLKFPSRRTLFFVLMTIQVVPQSALIPVLRDSAHLGINGTYLSMWIAHTGFRLPFATYVLFNYISGIPKEYIEAARDLTDLPPALVTVVENDVLCDEDQRYAKRLEEAEAKIQFQLFKGCEHGLTHAGPREATQEAGILMATFLKENLSM